MIDETRITFPRTPLSRRVEPSRAAAFFVRRQVHRLAAFFVRRQVHRLAAFFLRSVGRDDRSMLTSSRAGRELNPAHVLAFCLDSMVAIVVLSVVANYFGWW